MRGISRRAFGRGLAGAVVGAPAILRGGNLNEKLDIAVIGSGGRGAANMGAVASENIVAVCDVNARANDAAVERHPGAKKFMDFRKMFDHAKEFDAVIVSTCEHTHALATMMALRHGKHVYCEKPLTHNVWEARRIREEAAKTQVVTQMGIQGHAQENMRRVVELVQAGVIGAVRQVEVWVSRAWGLQSKEAAKRNKDIVFVTERPAEGMEPPSHLDWDLWLGGVPYRPFHDIYVPGPKWYRWWDFGNGTMSDLGSHWNDMPFWALRLKAPLTVQARGPVAHAEIAPASMSATYEYGARGEMPAVKLTWHQGESKPEIWKEGGIPKWANGVLFVGDKGMILADPRKHVLLPEKEFEGLVRPEPTIPRSPGHQKEWVEACKGGKVCSAHFEYSGWLTEANHLGNVAFRTGKKLEWDAEGMRARNALEAERFIRREYRRGWEL